MKLLALGDVVSDGGCGAVSKLLHKIKKQYNINIKKKKRKTAADK